MKGFKYWNDFRSCVNLRKPSITNCISRWTTNSNISIQRTNWNVIFINEELLASTFERNNFPEHSLGCCNYNFSTKLPPGTGENTDKAAAAAAEISKALNSVALMLPPYTWQQHDERNKQHLGNSSCCLTLPSQPSPSSNEQQGLRIISWKPSTRLYGSVGKLPLMEMRHFYLFAVLLKLEGFS